MSILAKIRNFDQNGTYKEKIEKALENLSQFKKQYPFTDEPQKIDDLTPEDLWKKDVKQMGDFFKQIEYDLKNLGRVWTYNY